MPCVASVLDRPLQIPDTVPPAADIRRAPATRVRPRQRVQSSACGCSDSITAFGSRIKTSSFTLTDMPSRIASVSGSGIRMVVPLPACKTDLDGRPFPDMFRFTTSIADAAAGNVGHLLGGGETGASQHTGFFVARTVANRQPLRRGLGEDFSRIRPAPSSLTSIQMLPP